MLSVSLHIVYSKYLGERFKMGSRLSVSLTYKYLGNRWVQYNDVCQLDI